MDNSVDRKNAIRLYLTGTIGQITVIAIIVFLLRKIGIVVDYTTVIGMIAIGIGGISSAMWGSIVTVRYRKINFKRIVIEFVNIEYYGAAEPPVRCGESHLSGLTEPLRSL